MLQRKCDIGNGASLTHNVDAVFKKKKKKRKDEDGQDKNVKRRLYRNSTG